MRLRRRRIWPRPKPEAGQGQARYGKMGRRAGLAITAGMSILRATLYDLVWKSRLCNL